MDDTVIFVASNQNVSDPKEANTHSMVIYQNYYYWWADENKASTRYTCVERRTKRCSESVTIANNKAVRSTGYTSHMSLTDNQVKILIKG